MRNPLNAIMSQNLQVKNIATRLQLLLRTNANNPLAAQLQEILTELNDAQEVQHSCTKLLNFFVEDLLCMAQIDKGTFRKNVGRFNLYDAINEIVTIQKQKAEHRRVTVNIELVGMDQTTQITTDMQRLQQVILSYQSNALKFTPTGGQIDIIASLRRDGMQQFLDVEVRDTGCGISEAN